MLCAGKALRANGANCRLVCQLCAPHAVLRAQAAAGSERQRMVCMAESAECLLDKSVKLKNVGLDSSEFANNSVSNKPMLWLTKRLSAGMQRRKSTC